jgi:Ketopantoate reductase PanE/ApbA
MPKSRKILILGASYGSLLGTKLAAAGHDVTLVCLPAEVEIINRDGCRIRTPIRGRDGLVEIHSKALPGRIMAAGPEAIDPMAYDLICLAMQEPQYRAPTIRTLMSAIAKSGKPCMSIMNMPPLPYLKRIPSIDATAIRHCFADATVWDAFDPASMTLCSPDPQAFRPPGEPVNVLQVRLATNFKAARFERQADTDLLHELEAGVNSVRHTVDGAAVELPVKLRVHDSIFVPLAKWSMLLTGNYRCVRKEKMISIHDAVHGDLETSKAVYAWVKDLCVALGANPDDLVPFEKYANAALSLGSPSSAARALDAGAVNIERVDLLVQALAASRGLKSRTVDDTVALVEGWLAANRAKAP